MPPRVLQLSPNRLLGAGAGREKHPPTAQPRKLVAGSWTGKTIGADRPLLPVTASLLPCAGHHSRATEPTPLTLQQPWNHTDPTPAQQSQRLPEHSRTEPHLPRASAERSRLARKCSSGRGGGSPRSRSLSPCRGKDQNSMKACSATTGGVCAGMLVGSVTPPNRLPLDKSIPCTILPWDLQIPREEALSGSAVTPEH